MPIATKNNALILKDGKLADGCDCCQQCLPFCFSGLKNSLTVDITSIGLLDPVCEDIGPDPCLIAGKGDLFWPEWAETLNNDIKGTFVLAEPTIDKPYYLYEGQPGCTTTVLYQSVILGEWSLCSNNPNDQYGKNRGVVTLQFAFVMKKMLFQGYVSTGWAGGANNNERLPPIDITCPFTPEYGFFPLGVTRPSNLFESTFAVAVDLSRCAGDPVRTVPFQSPVMLARKTSRLGVGGTCAENLHCRAMINGTVTG